MSDLVLVSGSSRGLGAHIAKKFVEDGYTVAINYFASQLKAEELEKSLGESSKSFYADIANRKDVLNMMKNIKSHFGRSPTILVNNALAQYEFNGDLRKKAEEISTEEINQQVQVTINGSVNLIQSVLDGMKKQNYGKIINIGTNLFQNPVVPYHDYIIAKGALLALTRSFAKDLGQYGIRVNMVSGGLLKVTDASASTPEEVFKYIAEQTPIGEVTTLETFTNAMMFFAKKDSDGVTGQNLIVDGGLTFN
tara:strand:+ start:647 stop:1399 length:753 start_codon:yes stop_codon:yes gene_type:complete